MKHIRNKLEDMAFNEDILPSQEVKSIIDEAIFARDISEDEALYYANIAPSAGDDLPDEGLPVVLKGAPHLFSTPEVDSPLSMNGRSDIGPLENTFLEYYAASYEVALTNRSETFIGDVGRGAIPPSLAQGIEAVPEKISSVNGELSSDTTALIQDNALSLLSVRLSNATINGNIINNAESHEISTDLSKGRYHLSGSETNIQSVSTDTDFFLAINKMGKVSATLQSEWNSIKNIEVEFDDSAHITIKNFVHVDVNLGGVGNSVIKIHDAKRGDITTGEGDDKVSIRAESNGAGWSNNFEIDTGAGDDALHLKGDDGHSVFHASTGEGSDKIRVTGGYNNSNITMGAGADKFLTGHGNDKVWGQAGNDYINTGHGDDMLYGGAGDDMLVGGKGADVFVWSLSDIGQGLDVVKDFKPHEGDALDISEVLDFGNHVDDLIDNFVRFAGADKNRDTVLEVRTDGEGDWAALAIITRGTQLENIDNVVEDGALII
jgi:Ca2+-binding RTX toxin-like protein